MRKTVSWFAIIMLIVMASCKPKSSYHIIGDIKDIEGEGIAILQDLITFEEDSTPFVNGHFEFTGVQKQAKLFRLYFIGPNDTMVSQMKSDLLYVQNGTIRCEGSYHQLMYYMGGYDADLKGLSIEGGVTNQIYDAYLSEVQPLIKEAAAISHSLEYPEVPAENMTDEQYKEALLNQRKMMALLAERNRIKDKYIDQYPNSSLAYDFVFASVSMDYHNEAWIDESMAHGNGYPENIELPDTAKMSYWYQLLEEEKIFSQNQMDTLALLMDKCKKLTKGAPFMEAQITTKDGDQVALSSQLKDGQYTIIDCWASWCHPCRASLPHLKQLYEKYRSKGLNVIGVSFDNYEYMKDQWLKAVDDEKIIWQQFQAEFDSDFAKFYQVQAIPNILIIGPDRNILKTGVRGFDLDIILQNIYGF